MLPFSVMKSEYDSSQYLPQKHRQWGSLQITQYVSFSAWKPSLFYPPQRALCEQKIHAAKQMLRKCLVQACWAHNRHSETVHSIKNPPHGRNRPTDKQQTPCSPCPCFGYPSLPACKYSLCPRRASCDCLTFTLGGKHLVIVSLPSMGGADKEREL